MKQQQNSKQASKTPTAHHRGHRPLEGDGSSTSGPWVAPGLPACINIREDNPARSSRPGRATAPHGAEDPHELHDESSPGTGARVIPVCGATRPTGSGWLRRRVAPLSWGGALSLPHLTFQRRAGHDPHGVTATHQQQRRAGQ